MCGRWSLRVRFEGLIRTFDSRTKVLLLCSPHNPVGRVWTPDELTRLADLCIEHNVVVCSDEIHADLIFRGYRHTPTAMLSEAIAHNTITCVAPSKTFNIAGLHTGITIIPNPALRTAFVTTKQNLGIGTLADIFGTVATEAAYAHGEEWLEELLDYLQGNLDFLVRYIDTHIPTIKVVQPEGTYLVWLDCRGLPVKGVELADFMLREARVRLNDGPIFGTGWEGFQRLNLACPRSLLKQALERIEQAVHSLG